MLKLFNNKWYILIYIILLLYIINRLYHILYKKKINNKNKCKNKLFNNISINLYRLLTYYLGLI